MVWLNYIYPVQEHLEAMTDQHTPSMNSASSATEHTSSCIIKQGGNVSVNSNLWDEWTQESNADDSVSTSNFLREPSSSTSRRLAFHPSDNLPTWFSGLDPLSQSDLIDFSHPSDPENHLSAFMQKGITSSGLILDSDRAPADVYKKSISKPNSSHSLLYPAARIMDKALTGVEPDYAVPLACENDTVPFQIKRILGPLSPSSPLAFHSGMLNPLRDPWDSCPPALPWSNVTTTSQTYGEVITRTFIPDHSASTIDELEGVATTTAGCSATRQQHTDVFIGPDGTFQSTLEGWTPHFYDGSETTALAVKPMRPMVSPSEAGCGGTTDDFCAKTRPGLGEGGDAITSPVGSLFGDCKKAEPSVKVDWPGKHRLELVEQVDGEDTKSSPTELKRPKHSMDYTNVLLSDDILKGADLRSYSHSSAVNLNASQTMDIVAIGPALNTNGKPRAKRGSATDPQSVYARHRREKINERLKNLQNLVPNGAKVDIVTMLDEAIHYVKFLQTQVELLKSDELWMLANPHSYNGMDISDLSITHSQDLESNI